MKKFNLLFFTIIFSSTLFGQIVINEFSAANYDSFQDNYGEYHDWIEIYNNSSNSIDLDGWYLSDKASNLTKWQFPASFILGANTTALIYCSGRDELIGGIAHTNFKITQTKGNEVFVISDPSSNIIDSITVVPHQKTHSRGRDVNGGTNWSVFTITSSPGTNNNGALLEYATTPAFSQPSGYYSCLLYTSPSPRDVEESRMPSSA